MNQLRLISIGNQSLIPTAKVYGCILLGLGIRGAASPSWREKLFGGVISQLELLKISTSKIDHTLITATTVIFPLVVAISFFSVLFATVSLVGATLLLSRKAVNNHKIQYLITYVRFDT